MDSAALRRRKGIALRPFLLAGGLGLFWFVEAQEGGLPTDAPAWGVVLILASRLFVDVVLGALLVSGVRVLLLLGRLGLTRWRMSKAVETR
jgi:hypothetical protein